MAAPIVEGGKAVGIVDIVARKAYKYNGGKRSECPIPGDMADRVEELYNEIAENAAGTSEELMEKYLETMELSADEIYGALRHRHSRGRDRPRVLRQAPPWAWAPSSCSTP